MKPHTVIERILTCMAKRRMSQVVRQTNGLDQILFQLQRPGNGAPQLGDLQRMRQPRAKQVSLMVHKDLGFVNQTPEGRRVNNAIAVALKITARGCSGFFMATSAAALRIAGIRGQRTHLAAFTNHHNVKVTLSAQAQQLSITSHTNASGAERMTAFPGPSISTKRISPASDFLSTRISSR